MRTRISIIFVFFIISLAVVSGATDQDVRILQSPAQHSGGFGFSVAGIGDLILIGAPADGTEANRYAGKAYPFAADGTHLQTFRAPDPEAAMLYRDWYSSGRVDARITTLFGNTVTAVGENILVGAMQAGHSREGQAYLFAPDGTHLHTFRAPDAQGGARFAIVAAAFGGRRKKGSGRCSLILNPSVTAKVTAKRFGPSNIQCLRMPAVGRGALVPYTLRQVQLPCLFSRATD